MKHFLQCLISQLLFGTTLFFAAGAPPVLGGDAGTDAGAGDAGTDAGGSDGADVDAGAEFEYDTTDDSADMVPGDGTEDKPPVTTDTKEEPELAEFKGSVTARFRKMEKEAPELLAAIKKYPKVQEQIEAVFRREAALRDVFPTVAEARQMREHFPNGLQDVQQVLADNAEVEALDKDFYTRDGNGNYPGHAKMLAGMFTDDREATVALMKSIPKEWARLDPESYSERMGAILASTLANDGVPEYIAELLESAKAAKQDALAQGLTKLLGWTKRFSGEKARPSAEEEKLQRDRQQFDREKGQRSTEEGQKFHATFLTESRKLTTDIVANHPAIKRLEKVTSISPAKRQEIVEKVRGKVEQLLGKSPSFMRKLRPAHESRNLEETMKVQRAAWSQPWLLNKMVRDVLRVETPALIKSNREAVGRRAGTPPAKVPAKAGEQKTAHTRPYQEGKNWYHADGRRMSMEDILRGKHEA